MPPDRGADGPGRESGHYSVEGSRQIGVTIAAAGQRETIGHNPTERLLETPGIARWSREIERDDTVEDGRGHPIGVAAEIGLRDPGAIRSAPQEDLVVAEPSSDLVHVLHRPLGGVEAEVSALLQPRPALGEQAGVEDVAEGERRVGDQVDWAGEHVGAPGASLIDHYHIAGIIDRSKRPLGQTGQVGASLPGTAGEQEQGLSVGGLFGPDDQIANWNRASATWLGPILGDG